MQTKCLFLCCVSNAFENYHISRCWVFVTLLENGLDVPAGLVGFFLTLFSVSSCPERLSIHPSVLNPSIMVQCLANTKYLNVHNNVFSIFIKWNDLFLYFALNLTCRRCGQVCYCELICLPMPNCRRFSAVGFLFGEVTVGRDILKAVLSVEYLSIKNTQTI